MSLKLQYFRSIILEGQIVYHNLNKLLVIFYVSLYMYVKCCFCVLAKIVYWL